MNAYQAHRGPDSEGIWSEVDATANGAVLAHRRLAILDLTEDGRQPMIDPVTGNTIVYNGEVYNYRQLRQELEQLGVSFSSQCDTEVVLKAYRVWGKSFVERLRGMFALVIWDAQQKRALCVRDRLGIKPLYYTVISRGDGQKTVLIASELRSLLATGFVKRQLSREGLSSYIWNGFVVGPQTIVKDIQLLPAATLMEIDAEGKLETPQRYWSIPPAASTSTPEQLAQSLQAAVKMRLVSDVPLGVFLSGGVDSSAIAALAVNANVGTIKTFNLSFAEAEYDEADYAQQVARSLGTEHIEVHLSQEAFHAQLEKALQSLDQPTFDAINTFYISQAVRDAGITVALAGTGGDELFGGYRTFKELPPAQQVSRALQDFPDPLRRIAAQPITRLKMGAFGIVPPQTRWGKLGDLLATQGDLLSLYQTFYSLFTLDLQAQLLPSGASAERDYGLPPSVAQQLRAESASEPTLSAISRYELTLFTGERLLRDTDAASMAVSLEVRVPLLDHEVVTQVVQQDPQSRFSPLGKKMILRRLALTKLDPALFERPKSGFVLPIERWSREQLSAEISATFADRNLCQAIGLNPLIINQLWQAFQVGAPGIYWSRIWSLYILLWWCRCYGMSLS